MLVTVLNELYVCIGLTLYKLHPSLLCSARLSSIQAKHLTMLNSCYQKFFLDISTYHQPATTSEALKIIMYNVKGAKKVEQHAHCSPTIHTTKQFLKIGCKYLSSTFSLNTWMFRI